jgi:hypothetical protein
MERSIRLTGDGKPLLTRQQFGSDPNVLCVEVTTFSPLGGSDSQYTPVSSEAGALELLQQFDQSNKAYYADLERRYPITTTEASTIPKEDARDVSASIALPAPIASPTPHRPTIEEIRASLTPAEIADAEARAATAVAKVRKQEIQGSWKAAAERITAEQSSKSTSPGSWERSIEKATAQQNQFRRNP